MTLISRFMKRELRLMIPAESAKKLMKIGNENGDDFYIINELFNDGMRIDEGIKPLYVSAYQYGKIRSFFGHNEMDYFMWVAF